MIYILTSLILFDLISEGSKRDSKSAVARGEKNGEHSQTLSCAIVEKQQLKNKTASQPDFLILQVKKNEIHYERRVFFRYPPRQYREHISMGLVADLPANRMKQTAYHSSMFAMEELPAGSFTSPAITELIRCHIK